MAGKPEPQQSALPGVRRVPATAALRWLGAGARDLRAHPLPSLFYGGCFALMGWLIVLTFRHAFEYLFALVSGFFLVGPFLALGLYDLSRRRERGEAADLASSLTAWRGNAGSLGVFVLVLTVDLLLWARASLIVFALFYTSGLPTLATFVQQFLSPDNAKFLIAYAVVGGFFAVFTFALSVVSVPMMLDRDTDGVVASLTSIKVFLANVPAMLVWGALTVFLVGTGFALAFVGLTVAVPLVGHATWHAYRELVEA